MEDIARGLALPLAHLGKNKLFQDFATLYRTSFCFTKAEVQITSRAI